MPRYWCWRCKKTVQRDRKVLWIHSHCVSSGEKKTRLIRVR